MPKRWSRVMIALAVGLCLGLAACSDHDTLPTEPVSIGIKDVSATWSGPPFPQACELAVSLERVSSSGNRPIEDGVSLTFTTDHWQFDNGQQQVVVETAGGQAAVRVVADAAGSATIRISGQLGGTGFGLTTNLYLQEGG